MDNKNNTGIENSGNSNSGNSNSGNWNSGYRNSGNWNSGHRNSGYWNSGYSNSGYSNSGNSNSGNWNSGNRNSGNWNSGNWNSGYRNSGYFNTDEPDKIRVFGKWLDMTPTQFSEKYDTHADIPINRWVDIANMTEEEKKSVNGYREMGGFLKTLDFKEACLIWWNENPSQHHRFKGIPGFDPKMFEEITGIKVDTEAATKKATILAKIEELKKEAEALDA